MSESARERPRPDTTGGSGEQEEMLTVQVGAGAGEPERLLHLSRPVDGMVRVREWTGESWNTPAVEREMPAEVLLHAFEEAARERRRLSEALYAIRLWLTGQGS